MKVKITRSENAKYFNCNIGDTVEVPLEEYIAGVVGSEIGNAPVEACKAQAVAARTYAVQRGVLKGVAISDDSSTAQAYRAPRSTYSNCKKAAEETAGQILTYNDKPISAVYSACNGGRTVSSKTRWGSDFPYLIEQNDPWDAATGKAKHGHGVGMSQEGAIYAASKGINYKNILAFYYPHTILQGDSDQLQELLRQLYDNINNAIEDIKKIGAAKS